MQGLNCSACRWEDAFSRALHASDVDLVVWLCRQVDVADLCAQEPPALSQSLLLTLVTQLGTDLEQACPCTVSPLRQLDWLCKPCCIWPELARGARRHTIKSTSSLCLRQACCRRRLGSGLEWMREAAMCLDPHDTVLSPYMQPILEPLLARLREATKGQHASQCRTLAHIVNSILHQIQRQ